MELTFEISQDDDVVEIHVDREGIKALINKLELLQRIEGNEHEHLMTASWGGSELTEDLQGRSNKLVHHVKMFKWQ